MASMLPPKRKNAIKLERERERERERGWSVWGALFKTLYSSNEERVGVVKGKKEDKRKGT